MALDSAQKRQAVPGVGRPWLRSQFPEATPTREWRASVGNSYPVANFEAPTGAAPTKLLQIRHIRNHDLGVSGGMR